MIRDLLRISCFAVALLALGCGGEFATGGGEEEEPQRPRVLGAEPSVALPGEIVTIYGGNFLDYLDPYVYIGDGFCDNLAVYHNRIVVRVPFDATSGLIYVDNGVGTAQGNDAFRIGTQTEVVEIEPNDDTHWSNATNEAANRSISGNLTSSADKDYFRIQNMIQGKTYRLHVSSGVGATCTINGIIQKPNSDGDILARAASDASPDLASWIHFGITGTIGPYSVQISMVP